MKHTKIGFEGLSITTTSEDKLAKRQRFWLSLAVIVGACFIVALLAVGALAFVFFGVLAIVSAVTLCVLDEQQKEHQRKMRGV